MFEPKVITQFELPSIVETNLGDLEPIIAQKIADADALVITDNLDDVKGADADAAELTKMGKRVGQFRRDFVAWFKKPLEKVESTCKDYERRLEDAASKLREKTAEVKDAWARVKEEELRQRFYANLSVYFGEDDRMKHCASHWNAWLADRLNPKTKGNWLNKGTSARQIDKEIETEIERVRGLRETVSMALECETEDVKAVAWDAFYADLSEEDAIRAAHAYKKQQAMLAEMRAATGAPEPTPAPVPPVKRVMVTEPIDLLTYRLAITGTKDALIALRKYGEGLGIKFVNLDRVVEAH